MQVFSALNGMPFFAYTLRPPPSLHRGHITKSLLSPCTVCCRPCSRQVYWGNGCQIIPPHDAGIAASIEQNLELWELPAELPPALVYDPTQQIAESYYSKLTAHLHMRSAEANAAAAQAVYTPLHGVGGKFVLRAFKVAGGVGWGLIWDLVGGVHKCTCRQRFDSHHDIQSGLSSASSG